MDQQESFGHRRKQRGCPFFFLERPLATLLSGAGFGNRKKLRCRELFFFATAKNNDAGTAKCNHLVLHLHFGAPKNDHAAPLFLGSYLAQFCYAEKQLRITARNRLPTKLHGGVLKNTLRPLFCCVAAIFEKKLGSPLDVKGRTATDLEKDPAKSPFLCHKAGPLLSEVPVLMRRSTQIRGV
ncbi:hypothetical protein [Geomonas silvestris]|uniref:hypothetical protein n=1 Tax=Geomonas silvestris TaxID=2740184 RepID=UPI00161AFB01|nr:hypothetical protein [Geomonas silvestris]